MRHTHSECHVTLVSSRTDGGIEKAFEREVSAERRAFIGGLKCMYFLNKREMAHTTNFLPFVELGKSLGATYLEDMNIGQNAKYTCKRFMQESVQALAEVMSHDIIESLQVSTFISLCIDETTDVAITKQLLVYGRYLVEGEVKTSFLQISELSDGTARTIVSKVHQICDEFQLNLQNLCGLGSDGASIMLGVRAYADAGGV